MAERSDPSDCFDLAPVRGGLEFLHRLLFRFGRGMHVTVDCPQTGVSHDRRYRRHVDMRLLDRPRRKSMTKIVDHEAHSSLDADPVVRVL